jgi:hypothetical protein
MTAQRRSGHRGSMQRPKPPFDNAVASTAVDNSAGALVGADAGNGGAKEAGEEEMRMS